MGARWLFLSSDKAKFLDQGLACVRRPHPGMGLPRLLNMQHDKAIMTVLPRLRARHVLEVHRSLNFTASLRRLCCGKTDCGGICISSIKGGRYAYKIKVGQSSDNNHNVPKLHRQFSQTETSKPFWSGTESIFSMGKLARSFWNTEDRCSCSGRETASTAGTRSSQRHQKNPADMAWPQISERSCQYAKAGMG